MLVNNNHLYNKPVERCAKSCPSFVSSAQPSVLALLRRTPADTNCAEGRRRDKSKLTRACWNGRRGSARASVRPSVSVPRVPAGDSASAQPERGEAESARAVNPRDRLTGARAASRLYREKRSSRRGLRHDAREPVNRGT